MKISHSFLHRISMAMAAVLTVVLAACSSDETKPVMEQVPADVDAVAAINLNELLTQAGMDLNGGIKLPGSLSAFNSSVPEELNEVLGAIDFEHSVMFAYHDQFVFGANISDMDKFKKVFEKSESKGDFDVYSIKNLQLFVKDGTVWVTSASAPEKMLKTMLDEAGKANITSDKARMAVLGSKAPLNIVFDLDKMVKFMDQLPDFSSGSNSMLALYKSITEQYPETQAGLELSISGTSILGDISLFDKDGKEIAFDYLTEINPEAVNYLPADLTTLAASGIKPGSLADKTYILESMAMILDPSLADYLKTLATEIGGTMATGMRINYSDLLLLAKTDPNSLTSGENILAYSDYIMLIPLSEGAAAQAVKEIEAKAADGSVKLGKLKASALDNYLVLGTIPAVTGQTNPEAKDFAGKMSYTITKNPVMADILRGKTSGDAQIGSIIRATSNGATTTMSIEYVSDQPTLIEALVQQYGGVF